jgi:putative heme-binding domain-containing protein
VGLATGGDWTSHVAAGLESSVSLKADGSPDRRPAWLAVSDVVVSDPGDVEFSASSNGTLRIWLNGRLMFQRLTMGTFRPDSDRWEASLQPGLNRLVAQVESTGQADFHVRFRRKQTSADGERLAQRALAGNGNADRGRALFFNAQKSQCVNCHQLGAEGGRIGPELTAVGSRFSRIHLIESILEPSRTIAPSFEAVAVALTDGRVLTGVRVQETSQTLTLGDQKAERHEILKSDVDEVRPQATSIMPADLVTQFSEQEFVDLIAFLASQTRDAAEQND